MSKILIIDDDQQFCKFLSAKLGHMGHQAQSAPNLEQGRHHLQAWEPDLVLLDIYLPDGLGLDLMPELHASASQPEVVIVTGAGDPESAELAITTGAWDYVQKGASMGEIVLPISRALQYRQEKIEHRQLQRLRHPEILGDSPGIQTCLDQLARLASSDTAVLIVGETGTGKELFARALHDNSDRAGKSFVVVDCAAIPNGLVESILFGHGKGAFTGADRAHDGLIHQAHLGTLFLDEVGELPLEVQKKFLRVLQERRFRPVGSDQEQTSDFRLVSATNRDLEEMVHHGQFREDLLYRLRAQQISLPPLRDRGEDLRLLVLHHLHQLCQNLNVETKGLSEDFWQSIYGYNWPGNVRELVNALEAALLHAGEAPTIFARHLPLDIRAKVVKLRTQRSTPAVPMPQWGFHWPKHRELPALKDSRQDFLNDFEASYLKELLHRTGGNITLASRIAGVSRQHLHLLLRKHEVSRPQ